jgi:hypothetical protein
MMEYVLTVLVVVVGFALYAFGAVAKLREGRGEQTAEMWYSRFVDNRRRGSRRHWGSDGEGTSHP